MLPEPSLNHRVLDAWAGNPFWKECQWDSTGPTGDRKRPKLINLYCNSQVKTHPHLPLSKMVLTDASSVPWVVHFWSLFPSGLPWSRLPLFQLYFPRGSSQCRLVREAQAWELDGPRLTVSPFWTSSLSFIKGGDHTCLAGLLEALEIMLVNAWSTVGAPYWEW